MTEENKDVAVVDDAPLIQPTPMTMIDRVLENPDFDVEKLDKMMQLQVQWEERQATNAFNKAFSAFQADVPNIVKNAKGAHDIRYATLDQVMKTIQPVLSAHGLAVRFSTEFGEGGSYIRAICTVSHEAGHSETSEITVPVDSNMTANNSQKMGSANSYAKRYALANALNLAFTETDDDAHALIEPISADQATIIHDLIKEVGGDDAWKKTFLKWVGADSVEEMPAKKFGDAKRYLEGVRDGNS